MGRLNQLMAVRNPDGLQRNETGFSIKAEIKVQEPETQLVEVKILQEYNVKLNLEGVKVINEEEFNSKR